MVSKKNLSLILCSENSASMKKLFTTAYSDPGLSFAILLLRLTCGGLMVPYGFNKFTHFASKSQTFSDPLHIGHAPSLVLVIFAELFCAIFVGTGLLTRLACLPLIITMCVVVFHVHHGRITGDGEVAALFLAGFIAILFTGPGKISIDRLIGK